MVDISEARKKAETVIRGSTAPGESVWTSMPDLAGIVLELADEVERLSELADPARLLGPARMVLDRAAEGTAQANECVNMAQRIVDLIGHPVTDEPPHALVELDALRTEVERLREWANRMPDAGITVDDPPEGESGRP